jgi:hypothetical protein
MQKALLLLVVATDLCLLGVFGGGSNGSGSGGSRPPTVTISESANTINSVLRSTLRADQNTTIGHARESSDSPRTI